MQIIWVELSVKRFCLFHLSQLQKKKKKTSGDESTAEASVKDPVWYVTLLKEMRIRIS